MLTISDFSYKYPDGTKALNNINLKINSGDFILIAGPNGCGKSTLLKALLGDISEYTGCTISGDIKLNGTSLKNEKIVNLAGKIGLVLQDPESQISNLTVLEEVTFGTGNLLLTRDEMLLRAKAALKNVGLINLEDNSVLTLSGGQLQRLSIATITAMQPKVLILDEPLSNLDPLGISAVVNTIKVLNDSIEIVIITTHWLDPFLDLANRLILMKQGRIVEDISTLNIENYIELLKSCNIEIPNKLNKVKIYHNVAEKTNITICSLIKVSYAYSNGDKPLDSIDLELMEGSKTSLVGHNGAGKTTLTRLIAKLRSVKTGSIISKIKKPAVVLQKPSLAFLTNSVFEEINFGSVLSPQDLKKLMEYLDLIELQHKQPFQLSGGEQRRLALGIALAINPDMLIMDEPSAGMDSLQLEHLINMLEIFKGTTLCVTHDHRMLGKVLPDILLLGQGRVLFHGSVKNLSKELYRYIGFTEDYYEYCL